MNYQPGWDTEWAATVPDFSSDLRYGHTAESAQGEVWRIIRHEPHRVEVKAERGLNNGRHFIETHQRRRSCADYEPSGLLTTAADLWVVFVGNPLASLKVYMVCDLRLMWQRSQLGPLRDGGLNGDNPTKGHVASFLQLDQLIESNKKESA